MTPPPGPQAPPALVLRHPDPFFRCPPAPPGPTAFHQGLPGYAPTPLVEVPDLARRLGVGRLLVKDESTRLGLPAFKALGASWAIHQALTARVLGDGATGPGTLDGLRAIAARAAGVWLVAATDGNHGRAVARFARHLGLPARIWVPAGIDPRSIAAIRDEDADVVTVDGDYDSTVAAAAAAAADPDAVLVQDTAWDGYDTVPAAVVEGYSTLFRELDAQLATGPDLVVVPVGVGSLAQAAVIHYRGTSPGPTALVGVEPRSAACVLAGLVAGGPVSVPTAATAMDGLNCGTPSTLAWPYLRDGLHAAVAAGEDQAAAAVTDLRAAGVDAGPCGAATLAGLRILSSDATARSAVGLTPSSVVVLLSTEAARRPRDTLL